MGSPSHVTTRKGAKRGKTVAIFCGVHGNERAGIMAVEQLEKEIVIEAGTVHFVHANPPAIDKNVRLVHANLNRLFTRKPVAQPCYEHERASELMDLLDTCDALLDLHSYPAPETPRDAIPFAICESPSFATAALFDVPIVVSGFTAAEEGGTDGYMHLQGKIGLCVEIGANEAPDAFVALGIETAKRFLAAFGCIAYPLPAPRVQQRLVLTAFYKKAGYDFRFAKPFRHFDRVMAGDIIATDKGLTLHAAHDGRLVFPYDNRPVGIEAFLLAKEN